MKTNTLLLVILVLGLASCRTKSECSKTSETVMGINKIEEKPIAIKSDVLEINNSVTLVKKSQNEKLTSFSFQMFKELASQKSGESYSFSPVSLNVAMGMVYGGARNNTAQEISKVMGFLNYDDKYLSEFSDYLNYLNSLEKDTALEFYMANKVFLEKTYEILPEYSKTILQYFEGTFESSDFKNNFRDEEKNIKLWVSEMTKNRIENLLPIGTLDKTVKMVLVNAIYIKSAWKYPFDKARTIKKDFLSTEDTKIETDFMIQRQNSINYYDQDGYQVIELPYNTPELSLIIILPHESTSNNLASLIPTGEQYLSMCANLKLEKVNMEIPKFKTESSFKMAKHMQNMGIIDAFGSADFSGMTKENDLSISEVIQKVFLEIDEKGSEAAAATAVIMVRTTSIAPKDTKIAYDFIANKPFFYVLKENRYNTPLFIGQYTKPE